MTCCRREGYYCIFSNDCSLFTSISYFSLSSDYYKGPGYHLRSCEFDYRYTLGLYLTRIIRRHFVQHGNYCHQDVPTIPLLKKFKPIRKSVKFLLSLSTLTVFTILKNVRVVIEFSVWNSRLIIHDFIYFYEVYGDTLVLSVHLRKLTAGHCICWKECLLNAISNDFSDEFITLLLTWS